MFPCTKNSWFTTFFSCCEKLQDERIVGFKIWHGKYEDKMTICENRIKIE